MTTIVTKYPFVGNVDSRQGGRDENQDFDGFIDTPLGLLLVVCDGMGGGPGGRTASHEAVNTILSLLKEVSSSTPRQQALQYAIEKANDVLYSMAKETPELRGMGTTVAAVIINEESAVIAHVGDTRIYLLRKGTIVYRSQDHSYVANLVRENKLTEEEARNHPRVNVITRALGIRPTMEVDYDEIPFQCGDRFVLCTDGIWGAMPQKDLVLSLSRPMGIEELTGQVCDEVDALGNAQGGRHDNMTLAIVDPTFDSAVKKIKKSEPIAVPTEVAPPTTPPTAPPAEPPVAPPVSSPITRQITPTPAPDPTPDPPAEPQVAPPASSPITRRITPTPAPEFQDTKQANAFSRLSIIICLAGIIALVAAGVYWYVKSRPSDPKPSQEEVIKVIKELSGPKGKTTVARGDGNKSQSPLKGSGVREAENKEIEKQIQGLVKKLDSLKDIKREKRQELRDAKREYIERVIMPDVNNLQLMMKEEKRKDLDEVKKMLNDKMAIGASKKGESTSESIKHIDKIKEKVIKLRE